ncbi:MAG: hypothetical protein OHK0012_22750 [Synechococcales cyanobacterium]
MPTGDPIDTPLPETGDPVEDLLLTFPVFDDEDSLLRLSSDAIRSNLWRPYSLITEGPNYVLAQFSAKPTKSGIRRIIRSNPNRSPLLYTGLLGRARGIVRDGNFYIVSDSVGGRLFRASVNGGFANEFATGLGTPVSVALIAPGEYVVTDLTGGRLLKVLANGTVTELATGLGSPYGVAVESSSSFLVTDAIGKRLLRVTDTGSVTELVTSGLDQPRGVRIASPNRVVVADFGVGKDTGRVLDIDLSGSPVITVVRSGGNPTDLVIRESSPELKIAFTDFTNNQLVEVDSTGGSPVVSTLADEDGTGIGCSLREAIIANNTDADFGGCTDPNGTISFANSLTGTITLTNAPPQIIQNVVIDGPGATQLAVSGDNQFRVVEIADTNNPVVTIENLTLTEGLATDSNGGALFSASTGLLTINSATISNSTATGSLPNGLGGGIRAANVTVTHSTLSGNSAGALGGGIVAPTVAVSDSILSGNSANYGGAIYAPTVTVSDSTLSDNSAVALGGGIYAATTVTVSDSILSSNSAGLRGGGIIADNATVSDSTLSGNSAGGSGGGIRADNVTVSNSTLTENRAGFFGGGLYAINMATVSNSTLSGNSAGNSAGGILIYNAATVSNTTIILNRANYGGGIRNFGSGSVVVNNTIVAGNTNTAGTTPNDISGTLTSGSNNLIGTGGSGGLTNGVNGNIVGVADITTVLDSTLADNGGPTLTHALVTDSPALEAGDPAICAADPVNNLDQRGVTRPQTGTNCDIGAFESDLATPLPPALRVNTLVDENGTGADCSLREAITAINTAADFGGCILPTGTINFANSLMGTITLTNAPPQISQDVVIVGPGANQLAVSGDNQFRVFEIADTNNPVVTIEKLTLTEGLATDSNGGALFSASTGLLTIDSVTISNSTATGTGSNGQGGGIRANTVTVTNSTLSGNSAGSTGGGITAIRLTVSDSTLSANYAVSLGGGIRALTSTVSNTTLSGNSAGTQGGGIDASGTFGTARVSNSTLSGNSAEDGGGIFATSVSVFYSTISTNFAESSGGGISSGIAIVVDSTLNSNSAGNDGGGIASGTAIVSNSTLSGNSAENNGGGIHSIRASLSKSTLSDNTASVNGGGLNALQVIVSQSTLSGNSSGSNGGGIFSGIYGYVTVSNSTLSGNSAGADGGGIRATSTATVRNSTFYNNRSSSGIGNSLVFAAGTFANNLTVNAASGSSEVRVPGGTNAVSIRHNVLRANTSNVLYVSDVAGTLTIQNNTIFTVGTAIAASNVTGSITISGNVVNNSSPALNTFLDTTLADNSTTILAGDPNVGQEPVLTHALVTDSPAIDAGDNALALDVNGTTPLATDQRGSGFTRIVNTTVDVGAFEVQ